MAYGKGIYKRSFSEKAFITFFIPTIILLYSFYKFPQFFVNLGILESLESLYFLGKSPSFWYASLYTLIVCFISGKVFLKQKSPYKKGKKNQLSSYQKYKFLSIFLVQLILLYIIPYYVSPLMQEGRDFFMDPVSPLSKGAYVYISKGFTSWGGMIYILILVPLSVYFFGKKYCSWFCACGNLAETIGVTKWGASWVKHKTPTGKTAKSLEKLQTVFMIFGLLYSLLLAFDFFKVMTASSLIESFSLFEELVIDFIFGALIGVGAYPFLGTRIWCRFGCPLAKFMEKIGKYSRSKFKVQGNEKCKGLNLCSQVCPMGIDVASFVHKEKVPTLGSFSLNNTTCIGCGGCVDICPVDGLEMY